MRRWYEVFGGRFTALVVSGLIILALIFLVKNIALDTASAQAQATDPPPDQLSDTVVPSDQLSETVVPSDGSYQDTGYPAGNSPSGLSDTVVPSGQGESYRVVEPAPPQIVVVTNPTPKPVYVRPTAAPHGEYVFIYPECDWNSHKVRDVYQNNVTGQYQYRNLHYQDGVCGYSVPKPSPRPQRVAPTAAPAVQPVAQAVAQASAVANVSVNPAVVVVTPHPPTPAPTITPMPTPVVTTIVQPATVVQPIPTTVVQPATTVVTPATQVEKLPSTGLPVAASMLGGLVPAGLWLRRFSRNKFNRQHPGLQAWQSRKLEKEEV